MIVGDSRVAATHDGTNSQLLLFLLSECLVGTNNTLLDINSYTQGPDYCSQCL